MMIQSSQYYHIMEQEDFGNSLIKQVLKKYMLNQIVEDDIYRTAIKTILSSDWDFTKMINFTTGHQFQSIKRFVNNTITEDNIEYCRKYNKYIKDLI